MPLDINKAIGEIIELIDDSLFLLENEHTYLDHANSILKEYLKGRVEKIKSDKIKKATEKAIKRKVKRIIRRGSLKERKFQIKFEQLNHKIDSFLSYFSEDLVKTYYKKLKEPIDVSSTILIESMSYKKGSIYLVSRDHMYEFKEIKLMTNESLNRGTIPLMLAIKNVRDYLKKYRNLFIKEQKDNLTLSVNIDQKIKSLNLKPEKLTILLDTGFFGEIAKAATIKKNKVQGKYGGGESIFYDIKMHAGTIALPPLVLEEMSYRKEGSALVSQRLMKYLINVLNAIKIDVNVTKDDRKRIFEEWKKIIGSKGRRADEQRKFLKSADVYIIGYCKNNPQRRVLILSNDNDMKTAHRFSKNVVRLKFEEGKLMAA